MKLTDKTAAKIIIDGHNIESLTHWTKVLEISWILHSIGDQNKKYRFREIFSEGIIPNSWNMIKVLVVLQSQFIFNKLPTRNVVNHI